MFAKEERMIKELFSGFFFLIKINDNFHFKDAQNHINTYINVTIGIG